jgi:hypothetical protein
MKRDQDQPEADVIIGAIRWQGAHEDPPEQGAEVIRLAPYLLARRDQA